MNNWSKWVPRKRTSITASILGSYVRCQRQARLSMLGYGRLDDWQQTPDIESLMHIAQKEWGLGYPRAFLRLIESKNHDIGDPHKGTYKGDTDTHDITAPELESKLKQELHTTIQHLSLIYPSLEITHPDTKKVEEELLLRAEGISQHLIPLLQSEPERMMPISQGLSLSMNIGSCRLSGRLDRIVMIGGAPAPAIVKSSRAPKNGVWMGDKIQATAYALLLEAAIKEGVLGSSESFKKKQIAIHHTQIEYCAEGIVRDVEITHGSRRDVIHLIDEVDAISGWEPQREATRNPDLCERCHLSDICAGIR